MIYELALISVAIGAGYWGWFFLRHRPHGTATFGAMQVAAAVLAALGFAGRRFEIPGLGVPGAIGVGAGVCLLVLGPLARALARRLVAAERMTLATRLLDVAELLAPGSGVAEEKALVRAMAEIREGRIDQTVEALTSARERASAEARLAIDERIAMLYLAAYRWRDAIAHAEGHLFGAPPPSDGEGSLRRALGIAPPVWVDLLAAYGRTGDLDQAARMLARLEEVCSGRDDAALWLHRARMMFLALAGRSDAVRALVAPRQARHMTPAARLYWLAVAHEHHGDASAAAAAYTKARARSRGRARDLIDQALAGLPATAPAELPALAREVVARVEAAPLPPPVRITRARGARATWLLTSAVLAVAAAIAVVIGPSWDIGVVVRAGAQVHSMTAAGQWWRVISCVFVHIGVFHLVLNAVGLFVIGRITEEVFGSARTIAVFGVAGIAGALVSYLASPAGISAGASGAVFGLLGAILVEITWHRARYRTAWKRGLWGGLAVVTVGQLAYDFLYPVIDQWAHGGGLLAGVLLGIALSPSARWARAGRVAGGALALAVGALAVVAAVFVVRTSLAESLTRAGLVRRDIDHVALQVPADWEILDHHAVQRDGLIEVTVMREPVTVPDTQRTAWLDAARSNDKKSGRVTAARAPLIALPAGWQGSELVIESDDEMDDRQRYRRVVCSRAFGDQMIFAAILVPETIASAAPEVFARLLASIGPAG